MIPSKSLSFFLFAATATASTSAAKNDGLATLSRTEQHGRLLGMLDSDTTKAHKKHAVRSLHANGNDKHLSGQNQRRDQSFSAQYGQCILDSFEFQNSTATPDLLDPESSGSCTGPDGMERCEFVVSQADADAHHIACRNAGGIAVEFPEIAIECESRAPTGGALATDTFAYINEVFCFDPVNVCAQFETTFCQQFDDVYAFLQEATLEELGYTEVVCRPSALADQCIFIQDSPTPFPTPVANPTPGSPTPANPAPTPPISIPNGFLDCAIEATDFQELNPEINPETSSSECENTDTAMVSCVFSNTPTEAARHHAACQASGAISVEFQQVDIICTGFDPTFVPGGQTRTINYIWENELFCFPPDNECAPFQESFCEPWANVLALLQANLLEEDVGWTNVSCFPQQGSAACNYLEPPMPVDTPVDNSNPTPFPTPFPTTVPASGDSPDQQEGGSMGSDGGFGGFPSVGGGNLLGGGEQPQSETASGSAMVRGGYVALLLSALPLLSQFM